jgi:hypothetical protein
MVDRQEDLGPDPLALAEAAHIAALDCLARVAQLTQDYIESAKVSFAGGDAAEIEEVKRDASILMAQHLAANRAVYEAGLEYNRLLEAERLD